MQPSTPGAAARKTEECQTISVPEAGSRYFGMSRAAAYLAAARGEIPTIRIGRLLRVPVRTMERVLDAADKRDRSN
jgi:hypothetical protein